MYLVRSFRPIRRLACMMFLAAATLASWALPSKGEGKESNVEHPTVYRTVQVDGLSFAQQKGLRPARWS